MTGLEFLRQAVTLAAAILVAAGVILILLQGVTVVARGSFAARLGRAWQRLEATSWSDLPIEATSGLLDLVRDMTRAQLARVDRGSASGILFMAMMFALIPGAAVFNLWTGGSPMLALYYLSCFLALFILNFAGESRSLGIISRTAALYLGASIFLLIPLYVFRSFADHLLNERSPIAVMGSLVVAPLLFIAGYGIMLGWSAYAGRRWLQPPRVVQVFLVFLPLTFILSIAALHFGIAAVPTAAVPRTWAMLLAAMVFPALSQALSVEVIARSLRGRQGMALALGYSAVGMIACGLSFAVVLGGRLVGTGDEAIDVLTGRTLQLDAGFWVAHLPLLPLLYFALGMGGAALAKAVIVPAGRWSDQAIVAHYPLRMTGGFLILTGAIAAGLGAA